jgi:hypothetical protein
VLAVDFKVKAHAHVRGAVRDQIAKLVAADARDAAVERESDRVENAALARPSGTGDDKEVKLREIDLLRRSK